MDGLERGFLECANVGGAFLLSAVFEAAEKTPAVVTGKKGRTKHKLGQLTLAGIPGGGRLREGGFPEHIVRHLHKSRGWGRCFLRFSQGWRDPTPRCGRDAIAEGQELMPRCRIQHPPNRVATRHGRSGREQSPARLTELLELLRFSVEEDVQLRHFGNPTAIDLTVSLDA
ncbi:hypothetical protein SBA3_2510002 [Candidatus Sulfopaludibacter sp. SbA3]|nr:hypothetical protein SBA3_2510002 [Candidatus Sulfopaludibacter sp. SbA3]